MGAQNSLQAKNMLKMQKMVNALLFSKSSQKIEKNQELKIKFAYQNMLLLKYYNTYITDKLKIQFRKLKIQFLDKLH